MAFILFRPYFLPSLATAVIAFTTSVFAETPVSSATSPESYAPPAPASATLKDTFKNAFLVGVALSPRQFDGSDSKAIALISREFNCATAENAMKWEALEPRNNDFDFKPADQFIDFCRQHDLVVVGHNLCWHSQLPSWVFKPDAGQEKLTRDVLLERLKNHITTVATHFKGKVRGWDVVNEAIADHTGEYRNSIFYRLIGKEYLALAFKWAHEADPEAELYYNDYNLDADDAKRARTIELVKYLREQGDRIDGIGLQGHYNLTTPSTEKIDETIRMFAALGLKVMITELDVQVIRNAHITGAVGAATGNPANGPEAWRPRLFPTIETLKSKLKPTDAQVAQITPIVDKATKDIGDAISSGEFHLIHEIRANSADAISKVLTTGQQTAFTEMMIIPPGGAPVGPPPPPLTAAEQQELAKRYGEIFDVLVKNRPAITRVTFWGLRDADSWRRRSSPLLFDDDYQRKPAYDAVIAAGKKAGL
ncbi:MAG TPA: endo-1,4-beta-xylanase [Lacunisphaera sp.]|jgi:endo-1,4-beta-xylanase